MVKDVPQSAPVLDLFPGQQFIGDFFRMERSRYGYQVGHPRLFGGKQEGNGPPHAGTQDTDLASRIPAYMVKSCFQILNFAAVGDLFEFSARLPGAGKVKAQSENAFLRQRAAQGDELLALLVGFHAMAEDRGGRKCAPGRIVEDPF